MEPESKIESTSSFKLAPNLTPDNCMALLDENSQPTAISLKLQKKFKEKRKKFKSANRRAMKALIESTHECRSCLLWKPLPTRIRRRNCGQRALKQRFNDQTETSLTYHIGIFNQLKAKGGETRINFVERLTERLVILRGMHHEVSEATKIERLSNGLSNIGLSSRGSFSGAYSK
jgi:hypothetical protein